MSPTPQASQRVFRSRALRRESEAARRATGPSASIGVLGCGMEHGRTHMKVTAIETLACDAGWRNYHFVKLSTDEGVVGWSEFDEGFGSPGVGAVVERLAPRVVGQPVGEHERIYAELCCATRPGSGGVVGQALGAIENALLDAKAKALGVPVYQLLGGKVRD